MLIGIQDAQGGPPTDGPARPGPDGSGSLTGVGATSAVDTDGDGKLDTFRVPVEVTVSAPGTWSAVSDLSKDGGLFLSARGTTELPSGPGVINVDVPAEQLLPGGDNRIFEVTNVVLADWSVQTSRLVAHVDSLGQAGPLRLSEITLPRPAQP